MIYCVQRGKLLGDYRHCDKFNLKSYASDGKACLPVFGVNWNEISGCIDRAENYLRQIGNCIIVEGQQKMDKISQDTNKEIIPIVFAVNDAYSTIAGVAIYSLIENANTDMDYNIYILKTDLSKEHQRKLKDLERDNVKITVVDVGNFVFGNKDVTSTHLTIEAVYRLLIPELLPQYDKVLYLDCDIIVKGDISELYHYEIGDHILGAVRCYVDKQREIYYREHLKLPYTAAFNTGVLLINMEKFRKENIKEKCRALLEEDWKRETKIFTLMDQDVLNITCEGKVFFISAIWNCPNGSYAIGGNIYDEYKEDFALAYKEPKVIHYTTYLKPWRDPDYPRADIFWRYARKTAFYEELLFANIEERVSKVERSFEKFLFPFDCIGRNKKIVLYGAGDVGNAYFSQIKITKWCRILAWVDRDYRHKYTGGGYIGIESPTVISEMLFDYIVIAIENKNVADGIKEELVQTGIPKEKIIWENPSNKA